MLSAILYGCGLVSHIKDRTQMEGVRIKDAEKNIWNKEGGKNCVMKRIIISISCHMLSE
jgi:hypothetical protein